MGIPTSVTRGIRFSFSLFLVLEIIVTTVVQLLLQISSRNSDFPSFRHRRFFLSRVSTKVFFSKSPFVSLFFCLIFIWKNAICWKDFQVLCSSDDCDFLNDLLVVFHGLIVFCGGFYFICIFNIFYLVIFKKKKSLWRILIIFCGEF